MSAQEVDSYIGAQPEPQKSALEKLRQQILAVIPEAQQCISYGMPGFRLEGKVVAGFASYKNHIGYYPHSGQVAKKLTEVLTGYVVSEKGGGVHFPIDADVPDSVIEALIHTRIAEALGR